MDPETHYPRDTERPNFPGLLRVLLALGVVLLLAPGLGGCAAQQKGAEGGGSDSYPSSARSNYQKGVAELKDENFFEAVKYFKHVKNKHPFSQYATLAEIRLADTYYAQDKLLEAIDSYKLFIRFHPTHPEVTSGYASYRICEGYVKQIPSDWILVPPSYEKDQGATKDALRELTTFMRSFPQSKYLDKAKELYRKCIRRLADHELYVARFYLERDKPKATILRLEGVLQRYPDAGVDPEVMLLLGKTYLKLEQRDKAQETFARLINQYPKDVHSKKARLYLKLLTGQREN